MAGVQSSITTDNTNKVEKENVPMVQSTLSLQVGDSADANSLKRKRHTLVVKGGEYSI